ncbi:MAG TPA: transketolase [bacterium]|nr:transketolase [bacterium]
MELVSRVHANNLVKVLKDRPDVYVLSADLTSSCEADLFRDAYPERFISGGIAEQNLVSFAGGLSREGFIPLIHTFGVFIYRRAYDQAAMSVAYPNLPVKFFGFLPGATTPGGATHQAIEDIALMRSLPNMTVIEPGDATEAKGCLELALSINGPVYVRMLRGEIPRLFDASCPMKLDAPRVLSEGTDITLFSSGICTEEAMRATALLGQRGVSVTHVHISTHKPFNNTIIPGLIGPAKYGVITLENHIVTGGLGTAVAEKMAEHKICKKLIKLGLRDTFIHGASRPYLMKKYGLDAMALVNACEELTGSAFDIKEPELESVRIDPVHSQAKPEAL